jgi:hypothetical protein
LEALHHGVPGKLCACVHALSTRAVAEYSRLTPVFAAAHLVLFWFADRSKAAARDGFL